MNAIKVLAALLAIQAAAAPVEPLVGTWRLARQEVNGAQSKSEPLTLKIAPEGDKLAFAFSVPVNDVYFVSMSYTAKLDGSVADVKNAHGETIGTIQLTASGPAQYKLILQGPNRPVSSGKLTVSADGKTLISEADTVQAGRSLHSKQFFSRY